MRIYTADDQPSKNLDDYRGRVGVLSINDLDVEVVIADARLRFGHLDLLVRPVAGKGERWVEQHRIALPA